MGVERERVEEGWYGGDRWHRSISGRELFEVDARGEKRIVMDISRVRRDG